MKSALLFVLLLAGCIPAAFADHITGGELYYTFGGITNGSYRYNVTVKLFMRCASGRQFNNPAIISVFDKSTNARITDINVPLSRIETLQLQNADPCITNPPPVCYEVGYYVFPVVVPASSTGYIITSEVMFRIDGINNLVSNYNRIGATYVGEIPSTSTVPGAAENNSAIFTGDDLVVICANNSFTYSFSATDADGDELRYSFCNAYQTTGAGGFGNNVQPPPPPPYLSVPYSADFTASTPLGNDVRIDEQTGVITGVAPTMGNYVVTVCVREIRNGVVIATQRKDIQVKVAACAIASASLPEEYMLCRDSRTLTARNLSTSTLINAYNWDIFNRDGTPLASTSSNTINHTFSDTGTYLVKLVVNRNQQCTDSTTALVRVYPGLMPDFNYSGACISSRTQFTDLTTVVYGSVTGWNWDFGENVILGNTSMEQHPSFQYLSLGNKNIRMMVQSSTGCRDTVAKMVAVYDKPSLSLAFRDTLICPPDNLRLHAAGTGTFTWMPQAAISNTNIASPVVTPTSTTRYVVELNDAGCVNRDSVLVRVVNQVSLQIMPDELICERDSVRLRVQSDALRYIWSPADQLDDPFQREPIAHPFTSTVYQLTASIGSCVANGQVRITPVPYPLVNAGADTTICFNTMAQLHGFTNGNRFIWDPLPVLHGAAQINPIVQPTSTTSYVLYGYDNKGCNKPGKDTVVVRVQPDILPFAGNDTAVVTGQPLQLQATGGTRYHWFPNTGLSATDIPNPVAVFHHTSSERTFPFKVLVYDETGCADSAYMQVRVFAAAPSLFVPSAFTPNGDGRNDEFKLIAAGIQRIDLFHVYNRWGQLMYSSPDVANKGWDGRHNGVPLPAGTFVWMVKATDYTGSAILRKGTVTLIR